MFGWRPPRSGMGRPGPWGLDCVALAEDPGEERRRPAAAQLGRGGRLGGVADGLHEPGRLGAEAVLLRARGLPLGGEAEGGAADGAQEGAAAAARAAHRGQRGTAERAQILGHGALAPHSGHLLRERRDLAGQRLALLGRRGAVLLEAGRGHLGAGLELLQERRRQRVEVPLQLAELRVRLQLEVDLRHGDALHHGREGLLDLAVGAVEVLPELSDGRIDLHHDPGLDLGRRHAGHLARRRGALAGQQPLDLRLHLAHPPPLGALAHSEDAGADL
mmetsp:Transcript_74513/g.218237  ORF Transcript_74513/g.218237 Transcript_74513/m.218237 type:complete len:275 (+) Transcript_74513:155-979(+)